MVGLGELWKQGELAFGQAVSTPYRNKRSHFDGQDHLEAGFGDQSNRGADRSGWLNRALQAMPDVNLTTAFAVGTDYFQILQGSAQYSKWSPERHVGLSPQGMSLLEKISVDDPLFRDALAKAS